LLAAGTLACGSNRPTVQPVGAAPAPTPAVPAPTPEAPRPTPSVQPTPAPPPVDTVEVVSPVSPSAADAPAAPPPSAAPATAAPPPAAAIPAQPEPPGAARRPYRDVLQLKQAGFSDEFLLNKIRTDNVSYQLTTSDILELRAAGLSESVLAAMLRSGRTASETAGTPVARRAEFDGLALVGKGALGLFGTSTKNVGRLAIDGEKVTWYDGRDASKNFSLYVKNVKEVFNTCVLRPGQNLCLELGFVTYTGEEYRFRDPGWKQGDNRLVGEATTYLRDAFPNVFFSQRAVSDM
jgi:hypothetical protein